MNSAELKSLQAPVKEKYRQNPESAILTLQAEGKIGEGISCSVETGRGLAKAGLHKATGGDGLFLCSGDMLLQALVACAGVTLNAVATALGLKLKDGTVKAEGEIDFRGTLGVNKDVPVGFKTIRLIFILDCEESDDKLETLIKLTERYCVVFQTITGNPATEVSFQNKSGQKK